MISNDADSEQDIVELHGWSCQVRKGSDSKQSKLRKVTKRVAAMSEQELHALQQMRTANADRLIKPPPAVAGKLWAVIDSGSQPNVANCKVVFPKHEIRERAGQRAGLNYTSFNGWLIPNEGECGIVHQEPDGTR